jgi:hypothetical protein
MNFAQTRKIFSYNILFQTGMKVGGVQNNQLLKSRKQALLPIYCMVIVYSFTRKTSFAENLKECDVKNVHKIQKIKLLCFLHSREDLQPF